MKKPILILVYLQFLCVLALHAQSAGSLDPAFGNNGYSTVPISGGLNSLKRILIQDDGKVLAVGDAGAAGKPWRVFAVRFLANGQLDTLYGQGGFFGESNFNQISQLLNYSEVWSAALQPDGKLVMAGLLKPAGAGTFVFVLRLTISGELDNTFANNGIFLSSILTLSAPTGRPVQLAVLPDAKLLLFSAYHTEAGFSLMRLTAGGQPDLSFGPNGRQDFTATNTSGFSQEACALHVQSDGNILALGRSQANGYVFRRLANGSADTLFANKGEFRLDSLLPSFDQRSILQPTDSRILALTPSAVLGLTASGQPDPNFGESGWARADGLLYSFVVQPDGKIVCSGTKSGKAMLLRFTEKGQPDSTFGKGGYEILNFPSTYFHLAIQSDGRLPVGGRFNADLLVARHLDKKTVSAHEAETAASVVLYPNPGNAEFYLDLNLAHEQRASVFIYSQEGRLVRTLESGVLFPAGRQTCRFSAQGLAPGQYVLVYTSENESIIKKFIIF